MIGFLEFDIMSNQLAVTLRSVGDARVASGGIQDGPLATSLRRIMLLRLLAENPTPPPPEVTGVVHMLNLGQQGDLSWPPIGNLGVPLRPSHYTPEVLANFDRITAHVKNPNPAGRLHILEGPAGTGKSYFIRGLLDALDGDAFFAFVTIPLLRELSDPQYIGGLIRLARGLKGSPMVLIVEEADEALLSRLDEGKASDVSTMLNLGDGLLGASMSIQIFATTNTPKAKQDAAILRPGRLATYTVFGALPPDAANTLWQELHGEARSPGAFLEPHTLAEVYAKI